MTYKKLITATAVIGTLALAPSAQAQSHRGGGQGGGSAARSAPVARSQPSTGRAVPRTGPPPHGVSSHYPGYYPGHYPGYGYYRPYYYPHFGIGFGFGYGFGLGFGFGYPYGYYGYPYPYGYYGSPYGYPYGYAGYGYYGAPYGYPGYAVGGPPTGGVRITDAPRDAEVFVDGSYAGVVDNFDGVFQHVDLEPGPHKVEIRAQGHDPMSFDVRVEPGSTITYRAAMKK